MDTHWLEFLRPALYPAARQFIAGETLNEALKAIERLNREGKNTTLNLLGEHICPRDIDKTLGMVNEYLRALKEIHQRKLRSTVSLKLTQMGLDIDEKFCLKNLETIAKEASQLGIDVEIDMESSQYTAKTIEIYLKLLNQYQNIRIALQAKLFRTHNDLVRIASAGGKIRLCKGAYKESVSISETRPFVIRINFLSFMAKLFEDTSFPAIATHDEDLIYLCKTRLSKRLIGSRKKEFEFQMLYGVAPKLQRRLVREGYNLRIYVPYGKEWLSYFLRRLDREFLIGLIKKKLQK